MLDQLPKLPFKTVLRQPARKGTGAVLLAATLYGCGWRCRSAFASVGAKRARNRDRRAYRAVFIEFLFAPLLNIVLK
jgi:hypothetical protein